MWRRPIEMTNTALNERRKLDRLQLVALAGLMFIGAAFVFSATMANGTAAGLPWFKQTWIHQIAWYALGLGAGAALCLVDYHTDRKSTRLNSSHLVISYAVFCLKKKQK